MSDNKLLDEFEAKCKELGCSVLKTAPNIQLLSHRGIMLFFTFMGFSGVKVSWKMDDKEMFTTIDQETFNDITQENIDQTIDHIGKSLIKRRELLKDLLSIDFALVMNVDQALGDIDDRY